MINLFDFSRFFDAAGLLFGFNCFSYKELANNGIQGVVVRRSGAAPVDPVTLTPHPKGILIWDTHKKGVLCVECFSALVQEGVVSTAQVQNVVKTVCM